MLPLKFLPIPGFLSGLFTYAPLAGFVWIASQTSQISPPASISDQAWLISVVVAAMGLTKIVMWVRNGDSDDGGLFRKKKDSDVAKALEEHSAVLEHLGESQQRMVDTQKVLADTQAKSLDIHARLLENMAVFKVLLENHEENAKAMVEQVAQKAVGEIKDYLRDK